MATRFPKYGFRKHRFNADGSKELESFNLGKLAYHIEKGDLDPSYTITMQDLFNAGALSQIKHGVKLLSKGADKFLELN
jgi:ribosomal protein L15